MNQSEFLNQVADRLTVSRKDVKGILEVITEVVVSQLGKKGPGSVVVPVLGVKLTVVDKPAVKAHMGTNPFTGESVMVKAKAARRVVKARAMKALNDRI